MKIDDLITLLDNRVREFKLSKDYAKMNGDLERMNVADKEIIGLEDILYKLNLLTDTSKSAAVKNATLTEIITDGSVAVLDEYDITSYATDPLHEEKIMNILSKMGVMDTVDKIDNYIGKYRSSPITGEMVMSAAEAYTVDTRLMMAIMEQDSRFGTVGVAVRTLNPGNVGNTDDGSTRTYESWQEGVTAVAEWLSRHRGSTIMPETPEEIVLEPMATSTSPAIIPTATTTPMTISTTTTSTITPPATTTPTTATTTPATATSTPLIITTPTTSTTTPTTATTTPETTASTTTTTSTSTPPATTTPTTSTTTPTTTATTTPTTATTTPATATSTTTTATTTSTE